MPRNKAVAGMMTQTCRYIHIGIAVMNKMKAPEKAILVHNIMYQPATEIECQHTYDNGTKNISIGPIYNSETIVLAPVRQFDNQNGNSCMQDEMQDGKYEIYPGMPELVFFVPHWQKGDGAFNEPKDQQAANQKSHSFQRSLLKGSKIFNDTVPHTQSINGKSYEEKIEVSLKKDQASVPL